MFEFGCGCNSRGIVWRWAQFAYDPQSPAAFLGLYFYGIAGMRSDHGVPTGCTKIAIQPPKPGETNYSISTIYATKICQHNATVSHY